MKCKVKVKVPRKDTKAQMEVDYSSTLPLTSTLDGVGGQRYATAT